MVVAEHSAPVKGRFLEILGHYDPLSKELVLKKEEIVKYINNGAQPSETVARLALKHGITEVEKYVVKRVQKPKKVEAAAAE